MMVKTIQIFFSIVIAVLVMTIAVKISLDYRGIYYADIERLGISKNVDMKNEDIRGNYNSIIEYLQGNSEELNIPGFKMSQQGRTHFQDVKKLFNQIDTIFYMCLIISILGIIIFSIKKIYDYLIYSAGILIAVPIVLSIFSFIDFNYIFTLFHKLTFSNDLWLFDPAEDPVINILPEEFFMHEAMLILFIMLFSSALLIIIYKKLKNKRSIC